MHKLLSYSMWVRFNKVRYLCCYPRYLTWIWHVCLIIFHVDTIFRKKKLHVHCSLGLYVNQIGFSFSVYFILVLKLRFSFSRTEIVGVKTLIFPFRFCFDETLAGFHWLLSFCTRLYFLFNGPYFSLHK